MARDDHQFFSNINTTLLTTRIEKSPISTKIWLFVLEYWQLLLIADNLWLKFKKALFLPLLGHIGPAIFHCNMGEETVSIAHHVVLHVLFLNEVTEFWQLLPIADNPWLK